MSAPILVTGSHRSGTTWTGRMLCLSGEAGYVHEPFNPHRRPGWSGNRIPYWFQYVCEENEAYYVPVVDDILRWRYPVALNISEVRGPKQAAGFALDLSRSLRARARRARPLLKDPFALFSADWLERRFKARVVVMIRHPAAFVSSIKELNWQFKFRSWLAQDLLLRDWLHPFEAEMRRCWSRDVDIIEQGIVMWNAIHHVIERYRERDSSWTFIRHEDLAEAPVEGFRALYERLGLRWDDAVGSAITRHSAPDRAPRPSWRSHASVRRNSAATARAWPGRLTIQEIGRVRAGTDAIARAFYDDADWDAPPVSGRRTTP